MNFWNFVSSSSNAPVVMWNVQGENMWRWKHLKTKMFSAGVADFFTMFKSTRKNESRAQWMFRWVFKLTFNRRLYNWFSRCCFFKPCAEIFNGFSDFDKFCMLERFHSIGSPVDSISIRKWKYVFLSVSFLSLSFFFIYMI